MCFMEVIPYKMLGNALTIQPRPVGASVPKADPTAGRDERLALLLLLPSKILSTFV